MEIESKKATIKQFNPETFKQNLISLVKIIYTPSEVKPLLDKYLKAIEEKNILVLKSLASYFQSILDYDRKYVGTKHGEAEYAEEKGYSWNELESARKELLTWINE